MHRKTLIRWARAGLVVGKRPNPNGKWLFATDIQIPRTADLIDGDRAFFSNGGGGGGGGSVPDDGHPGGPHAAAAGGGGGGVKAIYARVSTRKQLDDLDAQIAKLKAKYPDHVVFSDCASGLNFKRKGLLSLLQLAFAGRLQLVRVAHRDRLCRFAFDLLEHVFREHGAAIHVESCDLPATAERELAEDVLAVITVFGARLHGARSAGRRGRASATAAAGGEEEAGQEGGGGG